MDSDNAQRATCPVCQWTPVDSDWFDNKKNVTCPACGPFVISGSLNQWLWTERNAGRLEDRRALLTNLSTAIRHAPTEPYVTFENWEGLAAAPPRFSMAAKVMRLLEAVGGMATPGQRFSIPDANLPLFVPRIGAADVTEVRFLLRHLLDRGLIEGTRTQDGLSGATVTVAGWERLEPVAGGVPGRVSAFDDGIRKGIEDCGLDPRRVDRLEFAGKICDQILAEIRAAEIIVADFTGFRTGVFFEAGFALALGRTVVFTCRQDDAANLAQHFDTRQYPHLLWCDPADLRDKVATRIRALRAVQPSI